MCGWTLSAQAADSDPLATPAHRLSPDDPAWKELAGGLQQRPSVTADFTELRRFSFKKTPTALKGEVRVSAEHGLSLHYLEPEEQVVIYDEAGVLVRTAKGERRPPSEPEAIAANRALLAVLRLDLRPLAETFELYGQRTGAAWTLDLVPRAAELQRTLGQITVDGVGATVRRIEFRRSLSQRVEILVDPPRSLAPFSADELHRFFR